MTPFRIRIHIAGVAAVVCLVAHAPSALAGVDESVNALSDDLDWKVRSLDIRGTEHFSAAEAAEIVQTRARPWYLFWEARTAFDPSRLDHDLEYLLRAYENAGFFQTRVEAGVQKVDAGPLLDVWMEVEEGPRALVTSVEIEGTESGAPAAVLRSLVALEVGEPFSGDAYREGQEALLQALLNRSHAHAEVKRRADVDFTRREVDVVYSIAAGPPTRFADTRIEGLVSVDEALVRRELRYESGAPFSLDRLERSRRKLLGLGLFSSVRFEADPDETRGAEVPIRLLLQEGPARELRVGVGYSTEQKYGAHARWRHSNWLGGGRQFSASARYSTIQWSGDLEVKQPYLLGRRPDTAQSRVRVFRQEEDTFVVDAMGGVVGLEHKWGEEESLVTGVGFSVTSSDVSDVNPTLAAALGGVREKALAIGPTLGVHWDTTNVPLEPTRGLRLSFDASQFGKVWGGEYAYYKLDARASTYVEVGSGFVVAGRVHVGVADAIGENRNLPVFERFFSGGERSVRGYQRRELGPILGGTPAGGRSLYEASVELRRLVWRDFGAVAFLDSGYVSLRPYDFHIEDLKFSAGPGVTYKTPVGPLSFFVGFPFDPEPTEAKWQIHFSIGHFF